MPIEMVGAIALVVVAVVVGFADMAVGRRAGTDERVSAEPRPQVVGRNLRGR